MSAPALALVAQRTPFGRHLYAIGGNREAAFYSGIPIESSASSACSRSWDCCAARRAWC